MTYKKICVIASDSEAISLYIAKSQFKQRVFCLMVGDCPANTCVFGWTGFVVPPRNDGIFLELDSPAYIKAGLGVSRKTYSSYLGDSVNDAFQGRRNLPKNSNTDFARRLGAGV